VLFVKSFPKIFTKIAKISQKLLKKFQTLDCDLSSTGMFDNVGYGLDRFVYNIDYRIKTSGKLYNKGKVKQVRKFLFSSIVFSSSMDAVFRLYFSIQDGCQGLTFSRIIFRRITFAKKHFQTSKSSLIFADQLL